MALIASTAFFFLETQRVSGKWKTSLTVPGLVTLVAATHYLVFLGLAALTVPHMALVERVRFERARLPGWRLAPRHATD
jgi:hypothetical protein